MEVKIRAFLPAGMRAGEVMGRNSATGSPRRSITIMPPSAASRTNFEVWIWSSRTEVFLTMLHCSTGSARPGLGVVPERFSLGSGYNRVVLRFVVLAVLALTADLSAQTNLFPLKDVKPGMRGTGKTVFSGNQIEEFQVEILGVLENIGPKESLILARLSGGPLEHTGVMQGMSGSPVYIDGKLLLSRGARQIESYRMQCLTIRVR